MANVTLNLTFNIPNGASTTCAIAYVGFYNLLCNSTTGQSDSGVNFVAPNFTDLVWYRNCLTGLVTGINTKTITISVSDDKLGRCQNRAKLVLFPCCGCNSSDCSISHPTASNVAIDPACINSAILERDIFLTANGNCRRVYITKDPVATGIPNSVWVNVNNTGTANVSCACNTVNITNSVYDITNLIASATLPTDNITTQTIELCGVDVGQITILNPTGGANITNLFKLNTVNVSNATNCCTQCERINICNNTSTSAIFSYQNCNGTPQMLTVTAGSSISICAIQSTLHSLNASSVPIIIESTSPPSTSTPGIYIHNAGSCNGTNSLCYSTAP